MSLDVFASCGALYLRKGGVADVFLGTCFAFRHRHIFLTAAHCVRGVAANQLVVVSSFTGQESQVTIVAHHASADVAALTVDQAGMSAVRPFHTLGVSTPLGMEVCAIGFPEDRADDGRPDQPGRYFRAHIQRFFAHASPLGYRYHAAELSIGAPAGLSGGPVFSAGLSGSLLGVVAENFESTTYLRTIEELREPGLHYSEKIHSVINYGIIVWLPTLEGWLSKAVAPEF